MVVGAALRRCVSLGEIERFRARISRLQLELSSLRGELAQLITDLDTQTALPSAEVIDDLTFIKGIDPVTALALGALGITRFADIAALSAEDVAEISGKLGQPRRIAKESWIEQAAILATDKDTAYSRRKRADEIAAQVAASAAKDPAAEMPDPCLAGVPAKPANANTTLNTGITTGAVIDLAATRAQQPKRRASLVQNLAVAAAMLAIVAGSVSPPTDFGLAPTASLLKRDVCADAGLTGSASCAAVAWAAF